MLPARSLRPSPALVVAILALVVAMGGTSYAAITLAKNSVLSKHIVNGQVKTVDLKASAVTGPKVKDGSLGAVDFAAGELPAGPQGDPGPAGPPGPVGPAGPTDTITVVGSRTVATGNFDNVRVDCPAGRQALGGGLDTGNVFTAVVTSSYPVIDGNTRLFFTANGERPAATGWVGWVRNDSGSTVTLKVAVICGG